MPLRSFCSFSLSLRLVRSASKIHATRLVHSNPTIKPSKSRTHSRFLLGITTISAFFLYNFIELPTTYNDEDGDGEETSRPSMRVSASSRTFEEEMLWQESNRIIISNASEYGVHRMDHAHLLSNRPGEDLFGFYTCDFSSSPRLPWFHFYVYDGHNGASAAKRLASDLSHLVSFHLADLYSKHAAANLQEGVDLTSGHIYTSSHFNPPIPSPPHDEIHASIKEAFLQLDEIMVHEAAQRALGLSAKEYYSLNKDKEPSFEKKPNTLKRSEALRYLAESYTGSCAILGLYNAYDRTLHVALTGDSRAVLGRRVSSPQGDGHVYEIHQLTFDQTAKNPQEAARLKASHPDEPELLKNNRVLGWGPARAFGDGAMKWSLAVQQRLWEECLGDRPRANIYKTPPYFTAEPEVTTFEGMRRGDFVVVASDGLWDSLSNEDVVGLVGMWLEDTGLKETIQVEGQESIAEIMMPRKVYSSSPGDFAGDERQDAEKVNNATYSPSELPVIYPKDYKDKTVMYKYWRSEKRFISAEADRENVARHLLRNALGGADSDLLEALCMMEGSRTRRFRDDTSIQVIFFE